MLHFGAVDRRLACLDPNGALMVYGDYGGRKYVICRASLVQAKQSVLKELAVALDGVFNSTFADATGIRWGITNSWDEWAPSFSESGLWVDKRLIARGVVPEQIRSVLSGEIDRLPRVS